MRIAIMQPYFLPYAGYFRLFSHTDLFVVYDCVQFIRRGWIHRNRLPNNVDELDWLTLPLAKAPQDTAIEKMSFRPDAAIMMSEQFKKFPLFKNKNYLESDLNRLLINFNQQPTQYITGLLEATCKVLNLPFNVRYSSELQLPPELKGEERIIHIANHFQASVYINPPGGVDLYNPDCFKAHNLKIEFLSNYTGKYDSILPRLFNENIDTLRNEIVSQ